MSLPFPLAKKGKTKFQSPLASHRRPLLRGVSTKREERKQRKEKKTCRRKKKSASRQRQTEAEEAKGQKKKTWGRKKTNDIISRKNRMSRTRCSLPKFA